jgi:hypothetical protein
MRNRLKAFGHKIVRWLLSTGTVVYRKTWSYERVYINGRETAMNPEAKVHFDGATRRMDEACQAMDEAGKAMDKGFDAMKRQGA